MTTLLLLPRLPYVSSTPWQALHVLRQAVKGIQAMCFVRFSDAFIRFEGLAEGVLSPIFITLDHWNHPHLSNDLHARHVTQWTLFLNSVVRPRQLVFGIAHH